MTCSGSSSRHKRYPCLSNLLFPSSVFPQIIAVSKKLNHNPAVIIPPPFPPISPCRSFSKLAHGRAATWQGERIGGKFQAK